MFHLHHVYFLSPLMHFTSWSGRSFTTRFPVDAAAAAAAADIPCLVLSVLPVSCSVWCIVLCLMFFRRLVHVVYVFIHFNMFVRPSTVMGHCCCVGSRCSASPKTGSSSAALCHTCHTHTQIQLSAIRTSQDVVCEASMPGEVESEMGQL